MINIPSKEWFEEVTEYDRADRIYCPVCFDIDGNIEDISCSFCKTNSDSFNFGYSYSIDIEMLIKNIDSFKKLKDEDLIQISERLNEHTYDCPECSSIDDEQYTCTSCWGTKYSEFHRLLMILVEDHNEIEFANKLNNLMED